MIHGVGEPVVTSVSPHDDAALAREDCHPQPRGGRASSSNIQARNLSCRAGTSRQDHLKDRSVWATR
jgi:hypothetical protein